MADNAYEDLPVHPLIRGLAVGLKDATPKLEQAKQAAVEVDPPKPVALSDPEQTARDIAAGEIPTFSDPRRAEVVVFAGYLGPVQIDAGDAASPRRIWRLLYQDANAVSWLLVPQNAIVLHNRARDKNAAFKLRDLIWVRADAPVRQGTEEESQQARFLTGNFTSACDLHATLTDANPPPPGSGILCAPTPECRLTRIHY